VCVYLLDVRKEEERQEAYSRETRWTWENLEVQLREAAKRIRSYWDNW